MPLTSAGRPTPTCPTRPTKPSVPRPRLGFFGVIDERFDVPLLAAAADARPDWQFVMVGPVVKIDPAALPRRPNVHYLGQQCTGELPAFLAGWDVALLPFARNDSTKYISPTKTLEYMAAGKPIVSTPIADVAEPYGDMVGLGDTPEEFVAACDGRPGRVAGRPREAAGEVPGRAGPDVVGLDDRGAWPSCSTPPPRSGPPAPPPPGPRRSKALRSWSSAPGRPA